MSKYTYTLYKNESQLPEKRTTYMEEELRQMTTYQLNEICRTEKLVKSVIDPLNKEELIRLIMRYRGKSSSRIITEYKEEGCSCIEEFLGNVKLHEGAEQNISIPAKIVLYDSLGMDAMDHYLVSGPKEWLQGNVLLVDDEDKVCTVFYLKEIEGITYLLRSQMVPIQKFSKKQYYLLFTNKADSETLYDIYMGHVGTVPQYIQIQKIPLLDIQKKEVKRCSSPLVIDFGTSNTTAGIYSEDGSFQMIQWGNGNIIPSIIAVTGLKEDQPEYAFGYDAIAYQEKVHTDEDLSIFYDIKRFMSDIHREEHIITGNGIRIKIKRDILIREFLLYIIKLANQQFKSSFSKIQMLAPVKQKKKFSRIFKEMFPEYEMDCTIDEGVAVLFHNIKTLVDNKTYEKREWLKALILDCGGGTTDLTSCEFQIDNNRVSYHINMQVSYENGDTNFGGNNITYRIMQLLKIRIAGRKAPLKQESFRSIDRKEKKDLYKELDEAYKEAESYLPTRYKDYEDKNALQYFQVKNNYYYLFSIAEKIKKQFFYEEFLYALTVSTRENEDTTEHIYLDKWRLSILSNKILKPCREIQVTFYLHEIQALLRADIYVLMKKFLERSYMQGDLMDYSMIKLTGQSCKSPLFIDSLREFVPGRIIQDVREEEQNGLKLCCLQGALSFFQSKTLGLIEANPVYKSGVLPYEVSGLTHENQDKILIHAQSKKESMSWISRFKEGNEIHFYLKDFNGELLNAIHYRYQTSEFVPMSYEEIIKKYPMKLIQDETDNIVNGETRFFVWDERLDWGFYILPVLRDHDRLYVGEAAFFDFEDDTWEMNFFDGMK